MAAKPDYSLRVYLLNLPAAEFDALWVEAENYSSTGVLADDAQLRAVASDWYESPTTVHLLDIVHTIWHEMAVKALCRIARLETTLQDTASWLERTDRGGTAHHRHIIDVLAATEEAKP